MSALIDFASAWIHTSEIEKRETIENIMLMIAVTYDSACTGLVFIYHRYINKFSWPIDNAYWASGEGKILLLLAITMFFDKIDSSTHRAVHARTLLGSVLVVICHL